MALLGAVAWLARAPDWEPGITALGLLGSLLAQEYPRLQKHRDRDRALYLQFKEQFPSGGRAASFLRDHDIGGSFSTDTLDELDGFLHRWTDAEHEFIDRRLEEARKILLIVGNEFRRKLSTAITLDRYGRYSIGLHDMEMRPEMLRLQTDLNRLASRVFRAHQNFVRVGARLE